MQVAFGGVCRTSWIDADDTDFAKMLRFYNIFKLAFVAGFSVENPVGTWVSCMFLGWDSLLKKNNLAESVTFS